MSKLGKFIASVLVMLVSTLGGYCALNGGINYQIPIDYAQMSEGELSSKAEFYYDKALKSSGKTSGRTRDLVLITPLRRA